MKKVMMLVQSAYNGEIFREGKVYVIQDETAARWHASGIAKIVEDQDTQD
ncbi:hypothetical protein NC797_15200 [Aquibacillus sp. 3ASR75-11]|uniref:Uncharacterized protein n=1 Tax=Terrihalobacillus insolitus TaxID=2950438 RepID=A0A9X3WYX4_9BACI|nr:hypothetical protein [Terrihalobacillus insolitus]MDC3415011.1 hypothetical protein [Terrihalobacillus insolitus]MDC3425854.1 hypothetical protein [Terrihalobacillus insolitus]